MHQATYKLLDQLRQQMKIDPERVPIALETVGNTVSSTIPLLMHDLRGLGPAATRHPLAVGRFRRRLFLGRLPVDRNLGKQSGAGRRTGRLRPTASRAAGRPRRFGRHDPAAPGCCPGIVLLIVTLIKVLEYTWLSGIGAAAGEGHIRLTGALLPSGACRRRSI